MRQLLGFVMLIMLFSTNLAYGDIAYICKPDDKKYSFKEVIEIKKRKVFINGYHQDVKNLKISPVLVEFSYKYVSPFKTGKGSKTTGIITHRVDLNTGAAYEIYKLSTGTETYILSCEGFSIKKKG